MPVIIAETFAMSFTPVLRKMKNPEITATVIAIIPPTRARIVFGRARVHSLKSQLKSISGMASGTEMFIINFCMLSKVAASAVPGSKVTNPVRLIIMPTA